MHRNVSPQYRKQRACKIYRETRAYRPLVRALADWPRAPFRLIAIGSDCRPRGLLIATPGSELVIDTVRRWPATQSHATLMNGLTAVASVCCKAMGRAGLVSHSVAGRLLWVSAVVPSRSYFSAVLSQSRRQLHRPTPNSLTAPPVLRSWPVISAVRRCRRHL